LYFVLLKRIWFFPVGSNPIALDYEKLKNRKRSEGRINKKFPEVILQGI
jgi:hypothetical protein